MKEEIKINLSNHMRDFGLHMLARGIINATYSEHYNPFGHALSIVNIGHGTELTIKARIAEEHPLLIFSNVPKSTNSVDTKLGIIDLLENGQSLAFPDLPERLWAASGYKIEDIDLYRKFGKIRNQIIHLGVPSSDLNLIAYEFVFKILDNMINDWWNDSILNYISYYENGEPEYIIERLEDFNIKTRYSLDENYNLIINGK